MKNLAALQRREYTNWRVRIQVLWYLLKNLGFKLNIEANYQWLAVRDVADY